MNKKVLLSTILWLIFSIVIPLMLYLKGTEIKDLGFNIFNYFLVIAWFSSLAFFFVCSYCLIFKKNPFKENK